MENSDILRQYHQTAGDAWEAFSLAVGEEKRAYSRAFLREKQTSSNIPEAEHKAELDQDYIDAYVDRVKKEATYRRLHDRMVNARKLAELAKGGL